jgi:hypothetical protein
MVLRLINSHKMMTIVIIAFSAVYSSCKTAGDPGDSNVSEFVESKIGRTMDLACSPSWVIEKGTFKYFGSLAIAQNIEYLKDKKIKIYGEFVTEGLWNMKVQGIVKPKSTFTDLDDKFVAEEIVRLKEGEVEIEVTHILDLEVNELDANTNKKYRHVCQVFPVEADSSKAAEKV